MLKNLFHQIGIFFEASVNGGKQFLSSKRLGEVVIRSQIHPLTHISFADFGGEKNEWGVPSSNS
jgi:hypothetical protein